MNSHTRVRTALGHADGVVAEVLQHSCSPPMTTRRTSPIKQPNTLPHTSGTIYLRSEDREQRCDEGTA